MDAMKLISKMGLIVEVCTEKLTQDKREFGLNAWLCTTKQWNCLSHDMCSLSKIYAISRTQLMTSWTSTYLTGRDGMTNYFHFLHAGHFSFYLLRVKVKNLYKYSQQGSEIQKCDVASEQPATKK